MNYKTYLATRPSNPEVVTPEQNHPHLPLDRPYTTTTISKEELSNMNIENLSHNNINTTINISKEETFNMSIKEEINKRKNDMDNTAKKIAADFSNDFKDSLFSVVTSSDGIFDSNWLLVQLNCEEGFVGIALIQSDAIVAPAMVKEKLKFSDNEGFNSLHPAYRKICAKYVFDAILSFLLEQGFDSMERVIPPYVCEKIPYTPSIAHQIYAMEI